MVGGSAAAACWWSNCSGGSGDFGGDITYGVLHACGVLHVVSYGVFAGVAVCDLTSAAIGMACARAIP